MHTSKQVAIFFSLDHLTTLSLPSGCVYLSSKCKLLFQNQIGSKLYLVLLGEDLNELDGFHCFGRYISPGWPISKWNVFGYGEDTIYTYRFEASVLLAWNLVVDPVLSLNISSEVGATIWFGNLAFMTEVPNPFCLNPAACVVLVECGMRIFSVARLGSSYWVAGFSIQIKVVSIRFAQVHRIASSLKAVVRG